MQLECSDGSVAHSVGLQSTRVVVLAAVEGREILGAVTTSVAVEDNGDAGLIAIVGGVRERRLRRVGVSAGASLDGQVQLRRGPLSFADYGCDPTISRGLGHVVSGIEVTGAMACVPTVGTPDGGGRDREHVHRGVRSSTPPAR
jgi:hypothetical protein